MLRRAGEGERLREVAADTKRGGGGEALAEAGPGPQGALELPREEDFAAQQRQLQRQVSLQQGGYSPGDVVGGRYLIQRELGSGTSGTTYAAEGPDGTAVALKAMSLRSMRGWKQLELFEREAAVLRSLQCAGIPAYVDSFEVDTEADRAYVLVQELAEGKTLEALVEEGWRCDEQEVARIARELLRQLAYLAARRPPVVHRDVKPANIILGGGRAGGAVYLVDFGGVQAAALQEAEGNLGSTVIGTYGYMAPEQFRGAAGVESDLYGLGATLLYLLSGLPPSSFPQRGLRIDFEDKVPMGRRLKAVVSGMLEPLAEDRLSADQALAVLNGAAAPPQRRDAPAPLGGSRFRQQREAATLPRRPPGWYDDDDDDLMDDYRMRRVPPGAPQPGSTLAPSGRTRKPAGARSSVTRRGMKLEVDIPPAGLGGDTLFTGAFAVAWNAFVLTWTLGALSGGGLLFALFSLPFWVAGAGLAKSAFGGALMRERVEVGLNRWNLARELAMIGGDGAPSWADAVGKKADGDSADLVSCDVVVAGYVNGVPQTRVELREGVNTYVIGEGLPREEQAWLAAEINAHIQELSGSRAGIAAVTDQFEE